MYPSTEGTYRVLPGRIDDEWLLLEVDSADPTYVPKPDERDGPNPGVDEDLEAGNRIEATLVWEDDEPRLEEVTVVERTRFRFRRTDEPIFEAATSCFEAARAEGAAMNSRVTYGTDTEPNGVVYCFAKQSGEQDLFAEFRDGIKPLEPLVARATESIEPPLSVWILEPREPFVVVYIVFDPDGVLEETMVGTYS